MFAYVILGLVTGAFAGIFGLGGGVILIPALIAIFGINPHLAMGTSLAVIIPTAVSGVIRQFQYNNVDLKLAVYIMIGSVVGAWIGATISNQLSVAVLKKAFGVMLILIGVDLLAGWTEGVKAASAAVDSQRGTTNS
ncbi:sulfite exporter TauE/SafE family protein [bacterium]|nr:sulfite exporter TauE/SafE family protein [bacterium]